jgi:glycerophosphoryl diester phosphodiesterase
MTGFLDGPHPRAFAHRGWHTGDLTGLENTAKAFGRALAEGYRYLETDVHLTADGKLVAFHDVRLDRVTDQRGAVAALTWDEIRQARIGGREPIPLLAELLADFPAARFNIDAKSDATVAPLVAAIRGAGAMDRVCVASFSDRRLRALRSMLGPDVAMSLGPRQVVRLVARASMVPVRLRFDGAIATQVPATSGRLPVVTSRFVRAAHRFGLEVHVWTIDKPAEMNRLLDLGVDGLMSDRPDLLRDVLRSRGCWPENC